MEAASVANLASYVTVAGGREDEVAASANAEASGGDHPTPSSADADCAKGADGDSTGVASTSVESDIRVCGDVVRRCGTFVGLFEIIVFCALRRRRVSLWFVDGCVDVSTGRF